MVLIGNTTPIQDIQPELWNPLEIAVFRTYTPARDLYRDLGRGDTFVASQRFSKFLEQTAGEHMTLLPIRLQSIDGEQEFVGFHIVVPKLVLPGVPQDYQCTPSLFFCEGPFGLLCSESLAREIECREFSGVAIEKQ